MSSVQYDPSRRDQRENLPQSLRRIAVGLTGFQKRLFSDVRKFFGGKYKFPLFDFLAANLATLLPVAGARSQTSCPSITGEVTSPLTVGANQKCTIQSSGSIAVDTVGTNNTAVNLSAGPTAVKSGTITSGSVPNSLAPPPTTLQSVVPRYSQLRLAVSIPQGSSRHGQASGSACIGFPRGYLPARRSELRLSATGSHDQVTRGLTPAASVSFAP